MKWAFWISVLMSGYTYLGYPVLLWILARLRNKPIHRSEFEPTVSIVIAAHNELPRLKAKLLNLRKLDYDQRKLEIVVSSDGSSDGTEAWLRSSDNVKAVCGPERQGKTVALNRALEACSGEIVLFTDSRQELDCAAVRQLVSNFADSSVGCVSGELVIRDETGNPTGVGIYWKMEKLIRKLESATGSVMGATGAIYAARRSLVQPFPPGLVLDDVFCPVNVIRCGKRVVFEPKAIAWDEPSTNSTVEFNRKVRTLAGNYQILSYVPSLWIPGGGFGIRFISHKLFRLFVPWFLIIALITSAVLGTTSWFYLLVAIAQVCVYGIGFGGILTKAKGRLVRLPSTFCLLNAAAALALFRFIRYRKNLAQVWQPTGTRLVAHAGGGGVPQ